METNTFDLLPLFRSTIGFKRLNKLIDAALSARDDTSYPPYNIETTGDDSCRITMAVAGFSAEELTLAQYENTLGAGRRHGATGRGRRRFGRRRWR
jgi:molecular chaperone IbpA